MRFALQDAVVVGAVAGVAGARLPPGSVAASEVHCGYECVVK